ncbi:reticulophagy regulator 3-like [Haliotis rubra]|uniref:reticulophagy regulator 3-like n=1 Tax=Haliotis rubra TaxID=36100 RepID=UPI001EE5290B|nr:reticulophagy regulator 3-like [Haliotis rubra]
MDSRSYSGGYGGVKGLEEDIISLLSPIEPIVMRIQSLLVWEYPHRSAVMFICVHLLFWYLAATSMSSYFLISSATLILFFVDTWKKKIWPEIRVPPPVPDDIDGWTPVHPRLLNVLEISHHAAEVLHNILNTLHELRLFRRNNPRMTCCMGVLFSIVCMIICLILMVIGRYIPGIMLSYILVMSGMLWPCIVYHNVLKKAYLKLEPAFMWLEYNLKIKMSRSPKVNATVEDDYDEFCPPTDPTTTALLARAITDSEDEGGPSAIPTPQLSKEPSMDNSDNEEEDFEPGLERMPSFDDLDQTDDEFMPNNGQDRSMPFNPSHFGDDSDSDEDINFPDISEVDSSVLEHTPTSEGLLSAPFSVLASSVVSQTLSSMVENALHSVSRRGEDSSTSSYGRLPGTDAQITYTRTDIGEAMDVLPQDTTLEEEDEEEEDEDEEEEFGRQIEADIEKEFDFLDDFEPGNKPKK